MTVKISAFPDAGSSLSGLDRVTGLQGGVNVNFSRTQIGGVTSVATGTGLTGGPITTTGTVVLANTAVTPGSFTNTNLTVDQQGRITAAGNGSGSLPIYHAVADQTVQIYSGNGSAGNGTDFIIKSGGATGTYDHGGAVKIYSGNSSGTYGISGNVLISSGAAAGTYGTSGGITLRTHDSQKAGDFKGYVGSSTTSVGGQVYFKSGASTGNNGGNVKFKAGAGNVDGGSITFLSGNGSYVNGHSGNVSIVTGSAYIGGELSLISGYGSYRSGNLILYGSDGILKGADVIIAGGPASAGQSGNIFLSGLTFNYMGDTGGKIFLQPQGITGTNGIVITNVSNDPFLSAVGGKLSLTGIPTSAAGLNTGNIWCDTAGGLNILKLV